MKYKIYSKILGFIILFLILIYKNNICSGQEFIFNGYITDINHRILENVLIQIPKIDVMTYTDLRGYFELKVEKSLLTEDVYLCFSKINFITKIEKIPLSKVNDTIGNNLDIGDVILRDNDPKPGDGDISSYISGIIVDEFSKGLLVDGVITNTINRYVSNTGNLGYFKIPVNYLRANQDFYLLFTVKGYKPDTLCLNSNLLGNKESIDIGTVYLSPKKASVYKISSLPPNANIFIDGKYRGKAKPFEFKISYTTNKPDTYVVELRKRVFFYNKLKKYFNFGSEVDTLINLFNRTPKLSIVNFYKYSYYDAFIFDFEVPMDIGLNDLNYMLAVRVDNDQVIFKNPESRLKNKDSKKVSIFGVSDSLKINKEGCNWIKGKITIGLDTLFSTFGQKIFRYPILFYIIPKQLSGKDLAEFYSSSFVPQKIVFRPRLNVHHCISYGYNFINNNFIRDPLFNSSHFINYSFWYKKNYNMGNNYDKNRSTRFDVKVIALGSYEDKSLYGIGWGLDFEQTKNKDRIESGYNLSFGYRFYNLDVCGEDQYDLDLKLGYLLKLNNNYITINPCFIYNLFHTYDIDNFDKKSSYINFWGGGIRIDSYFKRLNLMLSHKYLFNTNTNYSEFGCFLGYRILF